MDVDRSFHLSRWLGVAGHQGHTSKDTWYLTKAKEAAAMLAIHRFGDDRLGLRYPVSARRHGSTTKFWAGTRGR